MHKHDRVSNVLHVSWLYASEQMSEYGKCTFMLMSPSCKQYVQQQEILIHMTKMHILILWS